jgi:hypothetical protein
MEVIELKIWDDSGTKSRRSGRDCTLSEQGLGKRLAAGKGGGVVGDSVIQKRASRKLLNGSGLPTPFVFEPAGPVRGDAHPERAKA